MRKIKTLTLIEEMKTDGHSPLKFLCDDVNVYYAKYRTGLSLKSEEIDCLFYEILCFNLLRSLKIPTPELALIEITAGSFDKTKLNRHKKFCKPGALYLGSKEIEKTDLVQSLSPVSLKRDFNKILNPYDLLKIALFDLWVNNCDRGRNENYNLLFQYTPNGNKYYAFDHAFCFGGLEQLRIFSPGLPFETKNKLFNSSYFKKILPFLEKQKAKHIVDNFISLSPDEINNIISDAYDDCPETWGIPFALKQRAYHFLIDESRRNFIKQTIWAILK